VLLLSIVGVLLVVGLGLRLRGADESLTPGATLAGALASRWIVVAVGIATVAGLWWCWGVWHPLPVVQDEIAYVLQARILAAGRWAAPSPPLPAFFEQAHVLVEPAVAAKYPPGHAMLLSLGALAGFVPLVPLALAGLSGALLFVLARRVATGAVALLAWVIWMSSPMVQRFMAGFYSESTTTACWLGGWLALLEWRDTGRRRWLVALALIIGLGAITRPLTMLVYAVPVGAVVGHDVVRRRAWRDLAAAMAAGCLVLAILPLWSAGTTGDPTRSPVGLYTQQYMPWDVPGFGFDSTPPARPLPPDLATLGQLFRPLHEMHTPAALPGILHLRTEIFLHGMWRSYVVLMPLTVIGLLALAPASMLAAGTVVLLLLGYLGYAFSPAWTLYYLEAAPVLAYFTAAGVAVIASTARRAPGWRHGRWRSPALAGAIVAGTALLAIPGLRGAMYARYMHRAEIAYRQEFARALAGLPKTPAVLFVRYGPEHNPHTSLVRNEPDLPAAPVWVVHDRGAEENARLLALAPGRAPYLFDEARNGIFPYVDPPAGAR
jgi:hypothetical protein